MTVTLRPTSKLSREVLEGSSPSNVQSFPTACTSGTGAFLRFFTENWGIDRKEVDKRSMKDF